MGLLKGRGFVLLLFVVLIFMLSFTLCCVLLFSFLCLLDFFC